MAKTYRIVLPLLAMWLLGWVVLSWPAIQDDALIHLRYADNLYLHHFITYDGVHGSYGASSLLYVGLLALLRVFTHSPDLPRAVSSAAHIVLVAGLALALIRRIPASARWARLAALTLLLVLVMPGAVRWLDDGMETGLGLVLISVIALLVHDQWRGTPGERGRMIALTVVAFFAVLLRTEYLMVCGLCFLILAAGREGGDRRGRGALWTSVLPLLGAILAMVFILATMHVPLPDTAAAKSHGLGYARYSLYQFVVVIGSAYSFGFGMLLFWMLTLYLSFRFGGGIRLPLLLANCVFPVLLVLSVVRGQEIQGIRYFAWTFLFSILWNILEIARTEPAATSLTRPVLLYGFLVLLVLDLPFESSVIFRVLRGRRATMNLFESQHLDALAGDRAIAQDVGYIGYFSGAQICDLSGLVNGRERAKWTNPERLAACAASNPQFIFGSKPQLEGVSTAMDLHDWAICGRWNFVNVSTPDTHYLVVPPALAGRACRATGATAEPLEPMLAQGR